MAITTAPFTEQWFHTVARSDPQSRAALSLVDWGKRTKTTGWRWHEACSPTAAMDARTHAVGSPLSVLIAEHASSSLEWLGQTTSGQLSSSPGQMASDVMVVSQQASESAAVFASRVSQRLSRLDAAGRAVTRAVLACGPGSDEGSLMARARTAQALLASLRNAGSATLTLAAPSHADPRLRYELMAIAGALLEGAQTSGPDIRVHFGSAPHRARAAEAAKKVA